MSDHTRRMSLNSDIGEGFGAWVMADDEALLRTVTDANVACGFHAGDPTLMRRTCETAAVNGVTVGAQVGFQDLRGFGRRYIAIPEKELLDDLLYQLGALAGIARVAGTSVRYVKPHGALYHSAVAHDEHAAAVVGAIHEYDSDLPLVCQPGTRLARHAQDAGLGLVREGFIDRAYTADGLLVPRGRPGAVHTDPAAAVRQAVTLATSGTVTADDGTVMPMPVDSLCVHSDSPGAASFARRTREALEAAGVCVTSLVETAACGTGAAA
ncbi:LamB/YcsF family protein [Streptomyces sp. AJS327]|uniref:LamB/YcsF family protein n=1 Tax=Streptomyces sp. AJS327 TaxID=2545265 RepID=UPI00181ABDC4|nr:5-oxoprolinase subunit PxpA [Streptomyces sp. AJS327]MBA0050919.1 LamB/YcsF family protein [Streptomyces sp. AJS327]